jgi:hypothetical protein
MRFIAFSTVHGLSIGYGDTAREARDCAISELQIRSDRDIVVIDCGEAGTVIWNEMTPLELVRQYRPIVPVPEPVAAAALRRRACGALVAALAALLLSGCAGYQRVVECRHEAGPEPDQAAALFGLLGAMVAASDPEHQAWIDRENACLHAPKQVAGTAP